ncbi:MAG: PQQ-binding-like beta-propeller repeat protein [Planctomyces sp.]|nr:PQQ-binding-like beta-propeller repeat protein [Planctomyces sp.]
MAIYPAKIHSARCSRHCGSGSKPRTGGLRFQSLLAVIQLIEFLFGTGFGIGAFPSVSAAEEPPQAATEQPPDDTQEVWTDRRVIQQADELRIAIQSNDLSGIRDQLRLFREVDPGIMVPRSEADRTEDGPSRDSQGSDSVWVPVFWQIFRQMRLLPSEVRSQIWAEEEARADFDLRAALAGNDPRGLIRVIHHYPGSEASCKAVQLIARQHLDRGQKLAAAFWLQTLVSRDDSDRRNVVAKELLGTILPPAAGEPTTGDSRGELNSATPDNLHRIWQQDFNSSAEIRNTANELASVARNSRVTLWSNWEPAIDHEQVYARSLRGIVAMDRGTGEVRWLFEGAANLEAWISSRPANNAIGDNPPVPGGALFSIREWSPAADLLHRNAVLGHITQDQSRLYLIDDSLALESRPSTSFQVRNAAIEPEQLPHLTALDKKTGRKLWTLGGPVVEDRFGNLLAGSWFAGPPVAAQDSLFTVVEQGGAISLVNLHAESGRVEWRTLLGYPQVAIEADRARRVKSASPVHAEGLIWAGTTTGWFCAVDSMTRTVLWTRRTVSRVDGDAVNSRTQPVLMTRPESIIRSWKRVAPVRVGTNLIVFPAEGHQLLCLDALFGELRFEKNNSAHVLPLHTDHEKIIIGGASGVEAISVLDGRSVWKTTFTESQTPSGSGTVLGRSLMIPTWSGTIISVDRETGAAAEVPQTAANDWWSSQLYADSGMIFDISPFGLSALKQGNSDAAHMSVFSRAQRLIVESRLDEAMELLMADPAATSGLVFNPTERAATEELRIQCLLKMAETKTEESLQRITDLLKRLSDEPRSLKELAGLSLVRYRMLSADATASERMAFLIGELSLSSERLDQHVGAFLEIAGSGDSGSAGSVFSVRRQMPFRTWLVQQVSELLRSVGAEDRKLLREQLREVSDENFAHLMGPELSSDFIQRTEKRLESGRPNELTLQLLQRASFDEASSASIVEQKRGLLVKVRDAVVAAELQTAEAERRSADLYVRRRLIEALMRDLESTTAAGAESDRLSGIWKSTVDDETILREEWAKWKDQPYTIIPVSQSVSFRQTSQPLPVRQIDDPFLGQFSWKLVRVPSVLHATGVHQAAGISWSVPGTFPTAGSSLLSVVTEVQRVGSILIVLTPFSVTGVSVTDGRVMWVRKMPENQESSPSLMFYRQPPAMRPDSRVPYSMGMLSGPQNYLLLKVSSHRVCILTSKSLEMIDLFTGGTVWNIAGSFSNHMAFQCRDVIFLVNRNGQDFHCLETSSGNARPTEITQDDLKFAVGVSSDCVVTLDGEPKQDSSSRLRWIHAATGETQHQMTLPKDCALQYLDPDTLVAVSQTHLSVISFGSKARKEFSTSESWFEGGDTDPSKPEASDSSGSVPLHVLTDPAHYYIVRQYNRAFGNVAEAVLNRSSVQGDGQITAIDRKTGEVRWTLKTGGATASMDQPHSPVLLLIHTDRNTNLPRPGAIMNPGGNQMVIRGILKTTGTPLFEHRQSSRYPIPIVQLETDGDLSVDVEAFGSRVRFVPISNVPDRPSFPEN